MRLKLKEKEIDENLSEKEFLKVLDIALKWGFFGIHRIYVKKIFTGILYIFFIVVAFLPCFIFKTGVRKMMFFTFYVLFFVYFFYVKDLIYIVMGRFKDKQGKVIRENCCKDKSLNNKKVSHLDLSMLLRLSRIKLSKLAYEKDYAGYLGLYLFYSGHFKKGMFYIILDMLGYLSISSCISFSWNVIFMAIFFICFYIPIFLLVAYDRRLIKRKMFKDKDGKIVCVKRTDEGCFY